MGSWAADLAAMTLATVIASSACADTLHVPEDYPTIQSAIDAASDDDVVLVEPGTYAEQIDLRGKAVTVRSAGGPTVTTIDGSSIDGSVVTMASGEGPDTVIEGFTVTGGTGAKVWPFRSGGGFDLIDAAPTVIDCVIDDNTGTAGGFHSRYGSPTIIGCTFRGNLGAALSVYDGHLVVDDCLFIDNEGMGGAGGAIGAWAGSSATVTNSVFLTNSSWHTAGALFGGGDLTVADCTFVENTVLGSTGEGGAIYANGFASIVRCRFEGNGGEFGGAVATGFGGEIHIEDCEFFGNSARVAGAVLCGRFGIATMVRCTITGNTAENYGIIAADQSTLTLRQCTLTGNVTVYDGGAIAGFDATLTLEHCVLRGNAASLGGALLHTGPADATLVSDCVFEDNTSRHGGAIADSYAGGNITIVRSAFLRNVSDYDGGAIDADFVLTVSDCTFDANVAVRNGGAIAARYGTAEIDRCVFTSNLAAGGGAVLAGNVASIALSTFCGNEPDDIEGEYTDDGGNVFCCPEDLDESGTVDAADIFLLLAAWGVCDACPEDLDEDGAVGMADLFVLLAAWGACP